MHLSSSLRLPAATLLSALALGLAASPAQAFNRGRQLSCVLDTMCSVKNMPLVAQCGSAADPVDADVKYSCGVGCATTSHMTIISAAWANRNAGSAYPAGARTTKFLNLAPVNAGGRNSWILRENSKNNGSYWVENPKAYKPPGTYPAYSMQNAVYDRAPASTTLDPAGCGLNNWWTCNAWGPDAQTYFIYTPNNTTLNNDHFKVNQDAGWVMMVSFYHQSKKQYQNGATTFIEYNFGAPHKVAVNGYNYSDASYPVRINDVGGGTRRSAGIGIMYAGTVIKGGAAISTALPGRPSSMPYLKYSDENELKFVDYVDYIWMR
jgi:hypothetical protein